MTDGSYKDSPWGEKAREELERYVHGKLNHDLLRYESQSKERWEQFFGHLAVRFAQAAVYGGGAGAVIGSIIPHTSGWGMTLLGLLSGLAAGAAKEVPTVVQNLTELIVETRKLRRSSIAYVARFR